MRTCGPGAGHPPDGLARAGLDLLAVEFELILSFRRFLNSSGKYLITEVIRCRRPNPQIEASRIAWPTDRAVPCSRPAPSAAFCVPTRHGALAAAHPEETHQIERGRLDAVLLRQDHDRGRPMKQPYFSSVPKRRMSSIFAGRMPPDAPPGR
jgi:hypothetical protein